jgi:hypothetical protein
MEPLEPDPDNAGVGIGIITETLVTAAMPGGILFSTLGPDAVDGHECGHEPGWDGTHRGMGTMREQRP